MKKNYLSVLVLIIIAITQLNAQTYATEKMRIEAEREIAEKNKRLGITETIVNEDKTIEKEKLPPLDIDVLQQTMYSLSNIEAKDYTGKHTAEEMKAFNQEMQEELAKTAMYVAFNLSEIVRASKKDLTQYSRKASTIEDNVLSIKNCKTCQENTYTIQTQNANTLVLALKPQDGGHYYTILFTLKK